MAEENKQEGSLIIKLLVCIVIGAVIGLAVVGKSYGPGVMQVMGSIQYFCGQIIFFVVPFVVIAFIGPAIVRLGANASKMLVTGVALAYISSVGAAFFAYLGGLAIFDWLNVPQKNRRRWPGNARYPV